MVSSPKIYGAHILPRDIVSLTYELQQVLNDVGKENISNGTQTKSSQRYSHRIIQCVNIEEEESEGQKRKTRTGMIKYLGLIH